MLSGTGGSSLTTLNGATSFVDYQTGLRYGAATPLLTYNLVGGSSTASSAVVSSFPLLQYLNGTIGGASSTYDGIAFRVRLGGYSLSDIATNPLTVQLGIGPDSNPQKATFGVGITLTYNSGTSTLSGNVFVADSGSSAGSPKPVDWKNTSAGGTSIWSAITSVSNTSTTISGGTFSTSYWSYQAVSGDSSPFNTVSGDTQDAWLTFGVTFNSVTSSAASVTSTSGILGFTSGTQQTYNVAVSTYQGSTNSTWVEIDTVGGVTAKFSDPVALASYSAAVPEPTTYLSIAALALPAGYMTWLRRRRKV